MSLATLNREMKQLTDRTYEKISDTVDTLGLDPDCDEVLEVIDSWFGSSVREGYEEWIS